MHYDFSGYATKNDLRCSDGRVIRKNAFKDNDGENVPLVWHHMHDEPTNVLGLAHLENRDDGVYAYCSFNETKQGQNAKELVKHGDITHMSIFANRLKQHGSEVIHGLIREVSLVMAGANPGAVIDNLNIAHADGSYDTSDEEAVIYTGLMLEHSDDISVDKSNSINHAEKKDESKKEPKEASEEESEEASEEESEGKNMTIKEIIETLNEKQKKVLYFLMAKAVEGDKPTAEAAHEELYNEDDLWHADEETIGDVFNTMTDMQKNAVYIMVGIASDNKEALKQMLAEQKDVEHSDDFGESYEGGELMHKNIFDDESVMENTLSHEEVSEIFTEARKRHISLKDSFLEHGITDISVLFPEAKAVSPTPDMITRDMTWVNQVWNATKKSPFSRIKSTAANLTQDDARAKGYIKGNLKVEEQFALLKRITTPQTVYKKQSLDRDDIIDITDIDIVAWLRAEMRMMLDEELARALLVGDGRSNVSEDKIKTDNIRPIYQDVDMYTIHHTVTYPVNPTTSQKSAAIVEAAIRARKGYKGSGNPTMYACTDVINDMLLATDSIGRRLYPTMAELASACRVKEIIEVPVLEDITRIDSDNNEHELLALIVNLNDYTVGADKGGAVNLFDDFDIDYNKQKYLIETRCSGALTHPYSAIAIEKDPDDSTF